MVMLLGWVTTVGLLAKVIKECLEFFAEIIGWKIILVDFILVFFEDLFGLLGRKSF